MVTFRLPLLCLALAGAGHAYGADPYQVMDNINGVLMKELDVIGGQQGLRGGMSFMRAGAKVGTPYATFAKDAYGKLKERGKKFVFAKGTKYTWFSTNEDNLQATVLFGTDGGGLKKDGADFPLTAVEDSLKCPVWNDASSAVPDSLQE